MNYLPKFLLFAAILSIGAAAFAAPQPAASGAMFAGSGQGYNGQTVTCSSDDGKRHYCNIDTRRGVQLTRQISGSACVQGQTWGYDNRGVWVDRGCRAEFASGGYGYGNGQGQGGQTISCSSDDGGRHYCNIDTRRGVQLTRQISGSACVQGKTWGYDNRGVWVDRGCRAEFSTGGYGYGNGYGQGQGGQTITCSSDDGGRHYCNIDTRGGVQLTQQISGSACVQGQTWGYDNRGVWVDRGCRAQFTSGGGYGYGNGYGDRRGEAGQTITCSSDDGKRHWCSTNTNDRHVRARLSRQISGSPCVEGQTWGVDGRGLWVDRGCRAEFEIR